MRRFSWLRNAILTGLFFLLLAIWLVNGYNQNTDNLATPAPIFTPLTKTLIPTRAVAGSTLPLTPEPVAFLLTTRAGQELQFRNIMLEPNAYVAFHTESVPQGIPMPNGVEISFDYIAQVDFDLPSPDWDSTPKPGLAATDQSGELVLPDVPTGSGNWPVTVILTDSTKITDSLGFKAHHKIHVTGQSNYGYLDIELVDIQKIVIQRTSTPRPIPHDLLGDDPIFIETLNGETVKVTNPKVFARCMYDVYCCHGEALDVIPLLGGADLALKDIKSIIFPPPSDLLSQVTVTLPDGTFSNATLRPSADCPGTAWRMRGKAALGDFEIELASIKKIER